MAARSIDLTRRWPSLPASIGLGLVALSGGWLLASLSLAWAASLLLVGLVGVFTWRDPAVGLAAVLFFGPFKPLTEYFAPTLPLDLGQWFLYVTLLAWLARRISRREALIPPSAFNLPLGIFVLVAALSLAGAPDFVSGASELLKWLQVALVMWLAIQIGGERRWRLVVALLLVAALFQAGVGIWQFFRKQGPEHFLILDERYYRAYGTLEQPNPFGGFIGLNLPLAVGLVVTAVEEWLARARRLREAAASRGRAGTAERLLPLLNQGLIWIALAAVLAGVLAVALLMSWSRGAWLGAACAALAMLGAWPRRRWLGALLVVACVSAGFVMFASGALPAAIMDRVVSMGEFFQSFDVRGADINPASYAVIERLAHWQSAVDMARDNPLLGVGLGNYETVYRQYAYPNWPWALGHAHNIYLNMLAETGLLGLVAYAGLWVVVMAKAFRLTASGNLWRRGLAIGLLGAMVHLSVHNAFDSLWVSNIFLHVGALLGVLSILHNVEREAHRESDLD